MSGFLPGLLLALIALAVWVDQHGWQALRARQRKETLWAQGRCEDCEELEDRCTCVVFTPDDWDEL